MQTGPAYRHRSRHESEAQRGADNASQRVANGGGAGVYAGERRRNHGAMVLLMLCVLYHGSAMLCVLPNNESLAVAPLFVLYLGHPVEHQRDRGYGRGGAA